MLQCQTTVTMANVNAAPTDVTSTPRPNSGTNDTKSDKRLMDVFKRRKPLTFSPKRQSYWLALISPLRKPWRKHDSRETVVAGASSSGSSSPAHSNNTLEEISFEIPRRRRRRSTFSYYQRPFSFDERDSAQRVERERRLQAMRQMQEQQWSSTFKAHPVRRYKPHIQPNNHSRPVHNSLNNV